MHHIRLVLVYSLLYFFHLQRVKTILCLEVQWPLALVPIVATP